ncbi:MAG: cation diffusion facilitator family transporter, partial [Synergistota bacterium]|nr:cation diffusion facilitator family transporter [Synergistota bacterium]
KRAIRVSWTGLWLNVALTAFKFLAGFLGNSAAMLADAVHSLSDFATDIVAIIGFRLTGRPVDHSHDFGHGKFETLTSAIVGISLMGVSLGIFWGGGHRILLVLQGNAILRPGMIALWAAVISIVLKEWLYVYTLRTARELKSDALLAKAWDHRSDALSSVGTLAGIGGAIFLGEKARLLDPLAALVVSAVIMKAALPITIRSVNEMLEASLPPEEEEEITSAIRKVKGVEGSHGLRTRRIGNSVAVNVHVLVDPGLKVTEAHDIATETERAVRNLCGDESFVSVHVEPQADEIPEWAVFDDGHKGMEEGPLHHERSR